jgi:pSer/pThr/pTyr-binding forkhead associated (FHA) protein
MWNLIISGPNYPLQRRPLSKDGTLLIGRSDDNEVVLPSESVSRRHAELWVSKEGVQISDLGSRNGTALNGRTLGSVPRPMLPGDVATIGVYTLKVEKAWDKGSAHPNPDRFGTVDVKTVDKQPITSPGIRAERDSFNAFSASIETIGKLATGVLRELGGPVQSIADQAQFLKDSVREIGRLMTGSPSGAGSVPSRAVQEQTGISYLIEEIPSAATRLLTEASRLHALVRAAKDFSNFTGLESASVDPNQIVAGAIELVRGTYSSVASFELQSGELGEMVCNPRVLYRALFTVLDCAIRKLDSPKPDEDLSQIRVQTSLDAAGICICVSQIGIKPLRDPHATQVLDTQETTLLSVDQLLQECGGSLSISDELGKGRIFCLRLPARSNASVSAAPVSAEP